MGAENDTFLSVGDPVVHTSNQKLILGNIKKMVKGNVIIKDLSISLNNLTEMNTVIISLQKLKTKESNVRLYWCGDYIGVPFEVAANTCMPIKPYIDVNPPLDMSKYYFDMQMINDIGVHLIVSNPYDANVVKGSDSTIQVNKKCFVCKKSVKHQEMRLYRWTYIKR